MGANGREMPSSGGRQRRKQARPGEILEAAFEEFARTGFAGTRLDDVAARAGITKGTIYVYFSSKEELFIATVKEIVRPVRENLEGLTAALRGSAAAILRQHFGFIFARMVEDRRGRELIRMLVAEACRFPELANRWHDEVIEPQMLRLRQVVAYGIGRGEFRGSAAVQFPELLLAPVIMACHWQSLYGESHPLDIDAYRDAQIDLLLNGLALRDGEGPDDARPALEDTQ